MTSLDPSNFLIGAEASKENAMNLRNASNTLLRYPSTKPLAIFCLYTAIEEIQKAIFCLFAHKKWMKASIISQIFSDHEAKSILFSCIYGGKLEINNDQVLIDKKSLTPENLKNVLRKYKHLSKTRLDSRNNCIYVGRKNRWLIPTIQFAKPELMHHKLMIELTALANFYDTVKTQKVY